MASDSYEPFPTFNDWGVADFDSTSMSRYDALVAEARDSYDPNVVAAAVDTLTRYAAIDTGALEGLYDVDRGFTMTTAAQGAILESVAKSKGASVAESIGDALAAYELVLDAATHGTPLSESWVRGLHQTICRSQADYVVRTVLGEQKAALPKGVYKSQPNNPTRATGDVYHYAPVSDVPAEMHRLISELTSTAFIEAHPVVQAAYAHYAFVRIHPFADGNGRVSRAMASVFLYRRPGVPLVIFADQRAAYLDALEAADAGNAVPFVAFVTRQTADAIDLFTEQLRHRNATRPEDVIAALSTTILGPTGISFLEMDALAGKLEDAVHSAFQKRLTELAVSVPVGVTTETSWIAQTVNETPQGFRQVRNRLRSCHIVLRAPTPGEAQVSGRYSVFVTRGDVDPWFRVTESGGGELGLNLRDVHPVLTSAGEIKVAFWVDAECGRLFAQLAAQVQASLRNNGYLD